ncbi:MAG: RNA methyltransferase [Sterolibacterium sp.]|jgi:23S rRNA (adenine2503-C2)-methyltransferase|nr:RNA methyltransferase [Sterolibacterium sp.]
MQLTDFHHWLSARGALPVHRQRILRAWLAGRALDVGASRQPAERFLPQSVRQALPGLQHALQQLAQIDARHEAVDGAARWLVRLADGQQVESVLLPRDGVCVSTQVGCAVGCRFCMTGQAGLVRQLSSLEIVAQVVRVRQQRAVKKVVFMGMGEPAHNLDAVLEAIDLLASSGGLGHKNLVLSTVGDVRVFDALAQASRTIRPALALSLHTTRADLRAWLLPRAPRLTPQTLIERAGAYAAAAGYPIQYQWTLLAGVNEGDAEWIELARLLRGQYAVVNLIPFNRLEGLDGRVHPDFQRPSAERIAAIIALLRSHGVLAKVRDSAGQAVEGGCGQLRARAQRLPL